jgi:hypothetical protein
LRPWSNEKRKTQKRYRPLGENIEEIHSLSLPQALGGYSFDVAEIDVRHYDHSRLASGLVG